jgi:lysozyme
VQPVWKTAALGVVLLTPAVLLLLHKSNGSDTMSRGIARPETNRGLQNLRAFLLMIQYAEGTRGINAYRTLFGGSLFNSFAAHPNIAIIKSGITSTAAGAYQFLYRTWAELQQALRLPDFSPPSQDRAAIELIRRKGALEDIIAGRIANAISKCRKVWASLPGAGYGQGERSMNSLLQVYVQFGGTLQ